MYVSGITPDIANREQYGNTIFEYDEDNGTEQRTTGFLWTAPNAASFLFVLKPPHE